jgi:hypothetical protein
MDKSEALRLLGGTAEAAREIGVTAQAIGQWPDPLTPKIADRIQAALWRKSQGRSRTVAPRPATDSREP